MHGFGDCPLPFGCDVCCEPERAEVADESEPYDCAHCMDRGVPCRVCGSAARRRADWMGI